MDRTHLETELCVLPSCEGEKYANVCKNRVSGVSTFLASSLHLFFLSLQPQPRGFSRSEAPHRLDSTLSYIPI